MASPLNFLKRFQKTNKSTADVKVGEGGVVSIDGKKAAVYKKSDTETTAVSPVCTHMGCEVQWNNTDKTWDCPCHGSRFNVDGSVKQDPATKPLSKLN